MASRKVTFVKINTVTFKQLNHKSLVVDNTTTDAGSLKRHVAAIQSVIDLQGTIVPKQALLEKLMIANMTGYPNQSASSHKLWAGKCFSGWAKEGIIEVI